MKKRNHKTLKLERNVISKLNRNEIIGGARTAECYTKQICPVPYDTSEPLEPMPIVTVAASVCFCLTSTC